MLLFDFKIETQTLNIEEKEVCLCLLFQCPKHSEIISLFNELVKPVHLSIDFPN